MNDLASTILRRMRFVRSGRFARILRGTLYVKLALLLFITVAVGLCTSASAPDR